jgi:hypothetical protein
LVLRGCSWMQYRQHATHLDCWSFKGRPHGINQLLCDCRGRADDHRRRLRRSHVQQAPDGSQGLGPACWEEAINKQKAVPGKRVKENEFLSVVSTLAFFLFNFPWQFPKLINLFVDLANCIT